MQNIGAANAGDEFYRYKMPKLVAKIEGRGNGIKTNIVNNVDIAKALDRPPEYVLKYYGCELGAQTNYEAKSGTCIVNGAHDNKKLSEILEGFIKKYVQCYSCGNPETQVKIKKEHISLKCKACGAISDVDPRHKLNTFILKNPPENKMSKEEKRLKKAEEERLGGSEEKKEKKEKKDKKDKDGKDSKEKKEKKDKKDKKKKTENGKADEDGTKPDDVDESEDEDDGDDDNDDDGVVWMTDTSAEAARKRAEEQLSAATAAMVTQGNIEAEQEEARKKAEKEARKKQMEEEAAAEQAAAEAAARKAEEAAAKQAAQAAAANGNDAHDDPVATLRSKIQIGVSAAELAADVKKLTVAGGLAGKMRVLYEAVFCSDDVAQSKLVDILKAKLKLFAALASDKPGQLAQLIALEQIVTVAVPERCKEVALLLKVMYEEDLAEDDVILAWAGKEDAAKGLGVPLEAAKAVRKAAAPIVEWLQEEEDDDEEDEEDED